MSSWGMFDQQGSLGYLTNRVGRVLARDLAGRLEPFGLAPAQFSVLVELERDDGLSQRELADRLDVEQGTMTSTLQRMVRDGLLERRTHESDRRAARWWTTARARAVLGPATAAAKDVNRDALARLAPTDRSALLAGLQQLLP
jgi:DNA-binding MarR family transcriptional regulator